MTAIAWQIKQLAAVSCPGGLSTQYRVQILDRHPKAAWQLAASFRDAMQADRYARELELAGQSVRIVAWRHLPTAM
jgi:hypothetical protein